MSNLNLKGIWILVEYNSDNKFKKKSMANFENVKLSKSNITFLLQNMKSIVKNMTLIYNK